MKLSTKAADSALKSERPPLTFVDQMKLETTEQHRQAETTGIVQDIIQKTVTKQSYALYLRNLQVIYSALERAPHKKSEATQKIAPFLNEMLHRTRPLEEDLKIMIGYREWRKLPILESCKEYHQHIVDLKSNNPIALLGHIYVRYLGDLNGGQVLERLLKHSLNLPDGSYNFYRYPAIINMPAFRSDYREMFNLSDFSDTEQADIIDAAIAGFEFNIRLSKDIKAFVRPKQ